MHKNCLEVQSLQRAIDILEVVGNNAKPVPLKTITAQLGLPKSTVYRLLTNLETRGYVRCTCDGGYQLGFRFMMMGQRVEQAFDVKHFARPQMAILNGYSKESVHLAVLHGTKVLYVDTMDCPLPIRLVAKVGATNAVHCTALGKALLIGHRDEEIREILQAEGMEKRTRYTLTTPEAFLAEMETVRRQGFAFDYRESDPDCSCVGAPIYNHLGKVVAAISVSGPVSRVPKNLMAAKVAPRLLVAVRHISKELGAP